MSEQRSGCGGIVGFLAVIALLIVGMFALGWVYLGQTETQTQIIIDKEKIKTDTGTAVEKGKQMMDNAADGIEEATEEPEEGAVEPIEQSETPVEET